MDLATDGTAGELRGTGSPSPLHPQAAPSRRVLRFPITGTGCATTTVSWCSRCSGTCTIAGCSGGRTTACSIDWDRVEDAVGDLRTEVEELYRHGIETSLSSYLDRRDDLIARYVTPNIGPAWREGSRVYSDEAEPAAPGSIGSLTTSSH